MPLPLTARWAALAAATAAGAVLAALAGVPAPALFGALAVGIAYALLAGRRHPLAPAQPLVVLAQALIGVALGTELDASTLAAVGRDWGPIALVTAGTLGISLLAGVLLARFTAVDRVTATLGLIAGGASGIVAMSDELGGDGRLVAFMQYLRVLVVVLTAPLLVDLVLLPGARGGAAAMAGGADAGLGADLAFTAGCALAGALLARLVRLTAGSLLGPLLVSAALEISGLAGGAEVPPAAQALAFAVLGIEVGLRFTTATIRQAGRLLPAVLGAIVAMIAACAAMAWALVPLAGVGYADAYLATTPGGLYVVLATAVDTGANTTFVLAVQALRLVVMVVAAPLLARALGPRVE